MKFRYVLIISIIVNLIFYMVLPLLVGLPVDKKKNDSISDLNFIDKPENVNYLSLQNLNVNKESNDLPNEIEKYSNHNYEIELLKNVDYSSVMNLNVQPYELSIINPEIDLYNYSFDVINYDNHLFNESNLDISPLAIHNPDPFYPYRARMLKIEGYVQISFTVDNNGNVKDIEIIEEEPDSFFSETVLNTVSRWKFNPGKINDKNVNTRMFQKIIFQLE